MIVLLGYIDPSSGSMFLQMVIGTVLAVTYAVRHQLARFWNKLRGKTDTKIIEKSKDGE